ncbi:MAG: hypothetical protein RDV48_08235 [Candidatus Eremiobacteraeota bacterium]|nr:hypothetical protein [Candidatus Eremiobacteraeota bacterium]
MRSCADVKHDDIVLIITEKETFEIGEAISRVAREITSEVSHMTIKLLLLHGESPPSNVAEKMEKSNVIFSLTRKSIAHTQARYNATEAGARFLSLPDYSFDVLESPALKADFRALTQLSFALAELLTKGHNLRISSSKGTEFSCQITGRTANAAPGWCWKAGVLASPPDAETNISIIEESSHGVLVIDGSIPCTEIGKLEQPLKLRVNNGKVIGIEGNHADTLAHLYDRLNIPATRIPAEFGIGLNPYAKVKGVMLEDEGCMGTIHIGMGSNKTIGGNIEIPFHLDHVICAPTVLLDEKIIIEEGKLVVF